jgi:hypothetical protein
MKHEQGRWLICSNYYLKAILDSANLLYRTGRQQGCLIFGPASRFAKGLIAQ